MHKKLPLARQLLLLTCFLGGCQRASAPIPSFSRDHNKNPRSGAEHFQELLATAERCVQASRQDLSQTQYQGRAKLLCRQSTRALQASPELKADAPLLDRVKELAAQLQSKDIDNKKAAPALQALEHSLDKAHERNDPELIAQLRKHAAKWHITGMQLRLALRSWRRCQESASAPDCSSKREATDQALRAFGHALDSLLAAQPFGTRSFRRCAQRSLLSHPPHAKGVAQLAPSEPSRLRNCERMAARIPWYPI